jgi:dTMP kinase
VSKFITVEGLDAAGKSSVIIPYLQSKLDAEKTLFVADMKTGKISSKIREIFMDPECVTENTDWRTIALLASCARSDMVYQNIIPALNSGRNVVCDRYVDTSFVYNLKSDTTPVDTILNLSTHLVYPHIIIFAYCSYEELVKRKSTRDDNDQWDLADAEAYNSKLERYREQLNSRNAKVIELNTSCSIEEVYKMIDEQVLPLI